MKCLVSNYVLIKINLHWTRICCISKRDTCNKFGVKICACRARTKKCDINEKKHLKYKVNGSQSITIWINLGLKGLCFIWNITILSKNLKYIHFTSRVLDLFIALYTFMLHVTLQNYWNYIVRTWWYKVKYINNDIFEDGKNASWS